MPTIIILTKLAVLFHHNPPAEKNKLQDMYQSAGCLKRCQTKYLSKAEKLPMIVRHHNISQEQANKPHAAVPNWLVHSRLLATSSPPEICLSSEVFELYILSSSSHSKCHALSLILKVTHTSNLFNHVYWMILQRLWS